MNFESIKQKLLAGERIQEDEALVLFRHPNLSELGSLADRINFNKNKNVVFYNINRHINPTNVCVLSCKFCSFSKKPGDEGAFSRSIDEMLQEAQTAVNQGATEVHMVGGLHPRWSFKHYVEMIGSLKNKFPKLHLKAFTAVEIDWFSKKTRRSALSVLQELKDAGLGSMPGGGAEIFAPEIRLQICDTKVPAERWLEIHQLAHDIGFHTNATMLYGHIENHGHRVDHLKRLRDQQDRSGGFQAFIPLSFQPHHNHMGINRFTNGADDLRTIAVSRLFLDNFQHIKAYWIMLGQDIAQLALRYGANDLDGTVVDEKISTMAGGQAGKAMDLGHLQSLIQKAGKSPIERNTIYQPLQKIPDQQTSNPVLDFSNAQVTLHDAKPADSDKVIHFLSKEPTSISELIDEIGRENPSENNLGCYLSQLPIHSPHREGSAENQNPIYKVLPMVVQHGVKHIVLDIPGMDKVAIQKELQGICK